MFYKDNGRIPIARNHMKIEIISKTQIEKRKFWIDEIIRLSGDFGVDAEKVEDEI